MIQNNQQNCYHCKGESYEPQHSDKLHPVNLPQYKEMACDTCLHNDYIQCRECKVHFHTDEMSQTYLADECNEIDLGDWYCADCQPRIAQAIHKSIEAKEDLHVWYRLQCI